MRTFKPFLLAFMAILSTLFASAQQITPGYQANVYGGYGHAIYGQSFTYRGIVDTGNQPCVIRSVEKSPTSPFYQWTDELSLLQLGVVNGPDSFSYDFGNNGVWVLKVRYRYQFDPDGPGGFNVGDDAVPPIIINPPIQLRPDPNPDFLYMEINGSNLDVLVKTRRHVNSPIYDAELVFDLVNTDIGMTVHYDSTAIDPVGPDSMVRAYQVYLPIVPAGELCGTVRLRFSHDGPGNSADFYGVKVGESIPVCIYWSGVGMSACELSINQSGYGFSVSVNGSASGSGQVFVHTLLGQERATGMVGEDFNTSDWTEGVYLVTYVDETTGMKAAKRVTIVR